MPRINTNDAANYIVDGVEFTSNGALSAYYDGDDTDARLIVRSYTTPIAVVDYANATTHLNRAAYSNTTSRHQNITADAARHLADYWQHRVITYGTAEEFSNATGQRARGSKFATVN